MQLDGTFTVTGDRMTFDFEGVGRSTFRSGDRSTMAGMLLTFIHAEPAPGSQVPGGGGTSNAAERSTLRSVSDERRLPGCIDGWIKTVRPPRETPPDMVGK